MLYRDWRHNLDREHGSIDRLFEMYDQSLILLYRIRIGTSAIALQKMDEKLRVDEDVDDGILLRDHYFWLFCIGDKRVKSLI